MHIVRRLFVWLLIALLPLLLLLTALDYGIISTIGNPSNIKKIINDSGLYQNLIPSALDQAQQQSKGGQSVSLVDPAVKTAAEQTFSPQFLRQSTDQVVDGVYRWLDGKASQPDFRLDLSSQKTELASLVAGHARQIAQGLPECNFAQSEAIARQGGGLDVFSAPCLPPGITPASAAAEVKKDMLANQDFLKDPVLTASSLKVSNNSTSTPVFQTDAAKQIPGIYQWVKRSPIILAFLSLLAMAGVVFIGLSRRKGLKKVGIITLIAGLLMLLAAWGLNYGVTKQALPKMDIRNNAVLEMDIKSLITDVEQAVDKNFWLFGGIYSVLGAAAIIAAWKYRRPAATEANINPMPAKKERAGTKSNPSKPKRPSN